MSEKQIGLGRLILQEAVKAGTWGAVFLIVMAILLTAIKQDIKEGIAYSIDRFSGDLANFVLDPVLIGKTKQLVKEGIEYSVAKATRGAREVVSESRVDAKSQAQPKP